ncbi:MAG: biotin synthase BioB [Gammaproteobacteria bacterium]|nr:biotin synthase BioB [Gammaproteobacteria bacterium]
MDPTKDLPPPVITTAPAFRHDWQRDEIVALFQRPLLDLVFQAQAVHRQHHRPNHIQLSTLLNIKSGRCGEDCAYCSQSVRYETGIEDTRLMAPEAVVDAARAAQRAGASRFCMGAAWRAPKDRDMPALLRMVGGVRALGMETCMTLGMLTDEQVAGLRDAGLDYYNHNLDTSPEFYGEVITTRTYQDRLATLERVRQAGIAVCSGGILGMGEDRRDRAGLLQQLASLSPHPESVPVNMLVAIEGTPLEHAAPLDPLELVRTIAVARVLMPAAVVRLSAGRDHLSDEAQALCFLAGANSIFYGDELLTTGNHGVAADRALFAKLGLSADESTSPAPA